jgi:hypothetical protein
MINYQVTWYGQIVSVVVASREEAEKLLKAELEDYKESYEAGWVTRYDPDSLQINATTKRVGEH